MSETGSQDVEFSSLVTSLAMSALGLLGEIESLLQPAGGTDQDAAAGAEAEALSPEERKAHIDGGLAAVRQIIETLGMLEKKTEGNLSDEEVQILGSVLTDLRLGFAKTAGRASSGITG